MYFMSKNALNNHRKKCEVFGGVRVTLPEISSDGEKPVLKFKNFHFHYQFPLPICVYGDFESILAPVSTCRNANKHNLSYTVATELHVPFSICCYIVVREAFVSDFLRDHNLENLFLYCGLDASEKFMDYIRNVFNLLGELKKMDKPMIFNDEDRIQFK